ncbi:MAG: DUF4290 domain-containing protein [Bacteroidota bacterium]
MEYNSQRELLVIPEYGRNVQRLILHAKTIEDDEERQAFIEKMVELMYQMHPQNRNIEDYKEKLWKHIFRIAKYDLKVTPPSGIIPTPEDVLKRPEIVPYPKSEARFRHYGNNVTQLIKKAKGMEDGPIKAGFTKVIGSYMKLAYKTWNREHFVSDEVIKNDLLTLSNGELLLAEEISIDNLADARKRKKSNDRDYRDRGGDRDHRDRNDRYSKRRNSGGGRRR